MYCQLLKALSIVFFYFEKDLLIFFNFIALLSIMDLNKDY